MANGVVHLFPRLSDIPMAVKHYTRNKTYIDSDAPPPYNRFSKQSNPKKPEAGNSHYIIFIVAKAEREKDPTLSGKRLQRWRRLGSVNFPPLSATIGIRSTRYGNSKSVIKRHTFYRIPIAILERRVGEGFRCYFTSSRRIHRSR